MGTPAPLQHVLALIEDRVGVQVDDPDLDLFDAGLLDSLGVVMLISALEEWLAWTLPLDDLDLEHFRSARRLTAYLESTGVLSRVGP